MKHGRFGSLLLFALLAVPGSGFGQGYTASLVDLQANTVVAHFATGIPGDNPTAVAWAGNATAFIINEVAGNLIRLDMTASPPAITATYAFPAGFLPHTLAINPAGTRALVSGDTSSVYLLDVTTTPFPVVDTITVPIADPGGLAFYANGTKAVVTDEGSLVFLDLSTVPAGVTTVSLGGTFGHAVAVNSASTRAAVSLDDGGMQTVNLTTVPPTLIGAPVGPSNADPLGVAVSPDGTRAIYVDEEFPAPEANVVNITGTPALVNSVLLPDESPSAVAFNPVTAAALIASDNGIFVLNAPYTSVSAVIRDLDPVYQGTTTYGLAVNPAGTFAIYLNEDWPAIPNTGSKIDLGSNTLAAHFVVGDNPTAVVWADNSTAYAVSDEGNTLVRLNMALPIPAITANYYFPPNYGPHALALNPGAMRALVTGDGSSIFLLNLATTPFSVIDTIPAPMPDAGGVAFYSAGTKAVAINAANLLFLDLSVVPANVTTVSLGANQGQAVAVNPAGTRAFVTLDLGGMQTVNLTTVPPTLVGAPVGPQGGFVDPLGLAVSPDGTRVIYVDEEFPNPEANVIDVSGTPTFLNSVPISQFSPSSVAFNPVTAAALIGTDDGVVILNPPYTAESAFYTDPGFGGATKFNIAVNPAGTFAILLNEDFPAFNQVKPAALVVDPAASAGSDGNGVLEPGETVGVEPAWANVSGAAVVLNGVASDIAGPAGATYAIPDSTATYGTINPGATGSCADTPDCYTVSASAPATRPTQHWDITFTETPNTTDTPKTWTLHVGESFPDVPTTNIFYRFIENLFHNGVTGGCGSGNYCPTNSVTRAQMAVFLLKGKFGASHVPPPATGTVFGDVHPGDFAADWIEELAGLGITGGCGGGKYCPNNPVTRAQMAVFLLKSEHGSVYVPPGCLGVFTDVSCPGAFAVDWIEQLAAEGITGGCGGGNYCPNNPNTRGQMAVFLVKTFGLLLYAP